MAGIGDEINSMLKDKVEINKCMENLVKDISTARFVIALKISEDGSLTFYKGGTISSLELAGLPTIMDEFIVECEEEQNDQSCEG